MEDPMTDVALTLIDRLDCLRGFLQSLRKEGNSNEVPEIDDHLATLDDTCKALQADHLTTAEILARVSQQMQTLNE
jgi:deoxyribodipyrimidine photolyase-like uncharacterized protein